MSELTVLPRGAWVRPYEGQAEATGINSPFGLTNPLTEVVTHGFRVATPAELALYGEFEDLAPGLAFFKGLPERYARDEEFIVNVISTMAQTAGDLSYATEDAHGLPIPGDTVGYENDMNMASLGIGVLSRSIVEHDPRGLWVPRTAIPDEGYAERVRYAAEDNYVPFAWGDPEVDTEGLPLTHSGRMLAKAAKMLREAAAQPDMQAGRILPVLDMAYCSALQVVLAANVGKIAAQHEKENAPLTAVHVTVPAELSGLAITFKRLGVQDPGLLYATPAVEDSVAESYLHSIANGYAPDELFY